MIAGDTAGAITLLPEGERPLALPAKPPERRLGRLPAVLMLLADHRDRVAQLPLHSAA
jgi:hypothetical protein